MITNTTINFRKVLHLLIPHTKELVWGGLSMFIYVVCWPLLAWLAGKLIPAIGEGNIKLVITLISQALLVFLIQKIAQFIQDTLLARPALMISQQLRSSLFGKLQRVELESLEKLSSGDIAYRLTEDADRVGEVIYKTIQDTTPCILQLIAVFGYMLYLDLQLSVATLLLAPLISVLVGKFGEKVLLTAEKSQQQVSNLAGLLGESIQSLTLIRAFGAEEWLQDKFDREVVQHRKARYKTLKLLALQHPIVGFIEASGILIVLAFGALRIQNGAIDGQGFSSFFAALLMLIDPISHLTTNFNELQQGQASLRRLTEIEKEPEEKLNLANQQLYSGKGNIEFKNVSFSYRNKIEVIKDINIKINSGEIVALVGASGAGKSTIFSLLLKFITNQTGLIEIDGNSLENISTKSIRNQMALVPQRVNILSGTILDSIRFGRDYSYDDVIKASKIANAHDFIIKLPNSYDTYIEERGSNLSGGQLQRISIARAVLGNPSILLLDEATSALDADSESAVQRGLKQAMNGRTVLIIAHRLSTTQEANKILLLDKGKIIETGTHDQLMTQKGKYSDLCEKQFIRQNETQ